MDTVIIGNGIIGLLTAYKLSASAANSDKIYIVGSKQRRGSATLAAGAMLNSYCELESDILSSEIDQFRFEMSLKATKEWRKDSSLSFNYEGESIDCSSNWGTYLINNTAADSLDDINFNYVLSALKSNSADYEEIKPSLIQGYSPCERSRATRAIYIPNEGFVNIKNFLNRLEYQLLQSSNITIVNDNVEKLLYNQGFIHGVKLKSNKIIHGDSYLMCAGASSYDLIKRSQLDLNLPKLFYGIGISILISSEDALVKNVIRSPNRGLACGLYAVPQKNSNKTNKYIIGTSNLISPTPQLYPRAISVESIIKGCTDQINTNFYKAAVEKIMTGWRPCTGDGYPIIGQSEIQNLYIATGTRRDGIHMAPVISDTIIKMMKGVDYDQRWRAFSPSRKLIRNISRGDAISKGVAHLLSAQYQHGFNPPHEAFSSRIKNMFKDDLERLHDSVGAHEWGIPAEMIDMYKHGYLSDKD